MGQLRSSEVRKWERRQRRAWHVRSTVYGTEIRPRLSVYRSNKHFHAQIIDDQKGTTLAAASTTMKELRDEVKNGGGIEAAEVVGSKLAEIAQEKGIKKVVF
ncbi:MAG: 50S ribosomal protein L18, partial [Planctomycetota bacterium]|nr:50S ribosomal protein L18 [Planctomycetota bacterium]